MFIKLVKVKLKMLMRQREMIFWNIIFPIFLITCLYLTGMTRVSVSQPVLCEVNSTYIIKSLIDKQEIHKDINYMLAVIGLTCYIMGLVAIKEMEDIMLRLSTRAIRMCIAPIGVGIRFWSSLWSGWLVNLGCIGMVLVYMKGILGINLSGALIGWGMMISLGTLNGLLLGVIIGGIGRWQSRAARNGMMAIITVGGSILSGLIDSKVKFYVDYYFPIIAKLNPISAIVDGLYTLNIYGMTERFYMNVLQLILFNAIGFAIIGVLLRRNKL